MSFEIENGVLKKYREEDGVTEVTIPDGVIRIGAGAFRECENLISIKIPDSVTKISNTAFFKCSNLKSITIPDSVTSIGYRAFYKCSNLADIKIPDGVKSISERTFYFCLSLTDITIPNSVKSISSHAFEFCDSLTSVTIPESVTSIHSSAFSYCHGLTDIIIKNPVCKIDSKDEYDFRRDYYKRYNYKHYNYDIVAIHGYDNSTANDYAEKFNYKFVSIGKSEIEAEFTYKVHYDDYVEITGCNKDATKAVIPDKIEGLPVARIGEQAFENCVFLRDITIPDSVTSIRAWAFRYCEKLTGIIIPDSVTSIGECAFEGCTSLADIKIGKGIKEIEYGVFANCINLANITIPDSIKSISYGTYLVYKKIIIYKDDVKVSVMFKDIWFRKKAERLLHNFIIADIDDRQQYFNGLTPEYKIPLALFMVFAYPQESSFYLDYLKRSTKKAVAFIIDEENIDLLYRFLEFGFVTKKNIDSLISYAVEHTQNGGSSEPQLVLSKYKNDNFGAKGADALDKLML